MEVNLNFTKGFVQPLKFADFFSESTLTCASPKTNQKVFQTSRLPQQERMKVQR